MCSFFIFFSFSFIFSIVQPASTNFSCSFSSSASSDGVWGTSKSFLMFFYERINSCFIISTFGTLVIIIQFASLTTIFSGGILHDLQHSLTISGMSSLSESFKSGMIIVCMKLFDAVVSIASANDAAVDYYNLFFYIKLF